jgi:hypothetical protein
MLVLNAQRLNRSFRVLVLASILFICTSTYFVFYRTNFGLGTNGRLSMPFGGASGGMPTPSNNNLGLHSSSQSRPPNITIIAIWNPGRPQPYLPNFFASVRANPQIHLLFVVLDKIHYGCGKRISPVEENIHEICFDTETYWRLHMDFLCEHWECTDQNKIPLLQTLVRRGNDDWVRTGSFVLPLTNTNFALPVKFLLPSFPSWRLRQVDGPPDSDMVPLYPSALLQKISANRRCGIFSWQGMV